ncbi:MAG: hypothetical protein D8H97_06820 [Neisseria sp.]|nr:MAG: hypothetical protein D8H97_06820 [Neisseria sp.]
MTRQRQQRSFTMTKRQSTITHSSAVGGGALLHLPYPLRLGFLLISLALFSSILIGCKRQNFPTGATWLEEIQLSNGKVITVRRTFAGKPYYQGNGYELRPTSDNVEVVDSKGLTIPPVWENKWRPLILDQDAQGVWYIVVISYLGCDELSSFPYSLYKVNNGQWQQVKFDRTLEGQKANLDETIKLKNVPLLLKLQDKPLFKEDIPRIPKEYHKIVLDEYLSIDCDRPNEIKL